MVGFANKLKDASPAFAFDDFLLVPGATSVLPAQTDVSTQLTKKIKLAIPVMAAAMDTVTESAMAITLAREGGLGVIHRNLTVDRQVEEVRKVKRSESFIIRNVTTVTPTQKLSEVRKIMNEKKFSGFPVIDKGKLVGIVTNRDIRFEPDRKKVKDVMTTKLVTTGENIDIKGAQKLLQKHKIEKLLIVKNNKLTGLVTFKDLESRTESPHSTRDKTGRLMVAAAAGLDKQRVAALIKAEADIICIDTAHGHNKKVILFVKQIKKDYDIPVFAGNVSTAEATRALCAAGADAVKVGVGPGSICTTRIIAGVGVPQLSAVALCADEAKKHGVGVIADGGVRYPSDIAKAIVVGADAVMVGNVLAGTDEAPGDVVVRGGRKFKKYRGMGSKGAVADRYFQEQSKFVAEGVEGLVPYKGNAKDILYSYVGGLRSTLGYVGAKNLKELKKKAQLVKITTSGVVESKPHDLEVIDEARWQERED